MSKRNEFVHARVDEEIKNAIKRSCRVSSRDNDNESNKVHNILNYWWRGHIIGHFRGNRNIDTSYDPRDIVEITIQVPRKLVVLAESFHKDLLFMNVCEMFSAAVVEYLIGHRHKVEQKEKLLNQ